MLDCLSFKSRPRRVHAPLGKPIFMCGYSDCSRAGCPKGQPDFTQGRKAETLQDYDAAFVYYQKAVKADPYNADYKIKLNKTRFEASQLHVKQGWSCGKRATCRRAAGEFQRAQTIDPSNPMAEQELRKTVEIDRGEKPRGRSCSGAARRSERCSLWRRCRRKSSHSRALRLI